MSDEARTPKMRLHDLCPKCRIGTIRSPRSKPQDQGRYRLRYLVCDNPQCDATGQEVVHLDHRGRVRSVDTPLVDLCPHCGNTIK